MNFSRIKTHSLILLLIKKKKVPRSDFPTVLFYFQHFFQFLHVFCQRWRVRRRWGGYILFAAAESSG